MEKKTLESSFTFPRLDIVLLLSRKWVPLDTESASDFILDFPVTRTTRKILLFFIIHPVYIILNKLRERPFLEFLISSLDLFV